MASARVWRDYGTEELAALLPASSKRMQPSDFAKVALPDFLRPHPSTWRGVFGPIAQSVVSDLESGLRFEVGLDFTRSLSSGSV